MAMMVSMETCLLRIKRRAERLRDIPAVRAAENSAMCFGGGFLLSAVRVWGQMQPVAMALTLGCSGWRSLWAAAGSAVGYRVFWHADGMQGMVWSMGALVLALAMPLLESGSRLRSRTSLGAACIVSATGLAFQLTGGGSGPGILLIRMLLAAGCAWFAADAVSGRDRVLRWVGLGLGVSALTCVVPALGTAAAALAMAAAPLPGAMTAAMGVDLAHSGGVTMTAVVCTAFFLERLPLPRPWRSAAAPGIACAAWMGLLRMWEPAQLAAVLCGGMLALALPAKPAAAPGKLGAAQVHLEQTARVLGQFQRQLLAYAAPAPDSAALAQQLREKSCSQCDIRAECRIRQRLDEKMVESSEPFLCRKPQLAMAELRRSRAELRRIKAARAAQEEYRMALVQQYGFLCDALHRLADRLGHRETRRAQFRVQVSARSRGRVSADGDRVSAFPGSGCRYYVILCDGMGTGLGAAEESRRASKLIRQMLGAGLPPQTVLGSLNNQLALTDRGGAVTVDLAEVRLDSGKVWLYKWGAGPSWLLRRNRCVMVGTSGPPPGLGVSAGQENISRVAMDREEILLMVSDGICTDRAAHWASCNAGSIGSLAEQVLQDGGSGEDDATAVALRLVRSG